MEVISSESVLYKNLRALKVQFKMDRADNSYSKVRTVYVSLDSYLVNVIDIEQYTYTSQGINQSYNVLKLLEVNLENPKTIWKE